jgi:oligoendopeptidase F
MLARIHAFGQLCDGGRGAGKLHQRVSEVAMRSRVPDPPEPGDPPGIDAMCTAVALRGSALWLAAHRGDAKPAARRWTWAEASAVAIAAAASLSPEAGAAVQRTVAEDRIHARHPGGPLSHPAGDRGPYVRLEFDGSLRSVMTLAHELGHAAHQMLSRPLGVLRCGPRPALAETAAAANEQAAFAILLAEADSADAREHLLAYRRRDLAAVILRHVALHRFEVVSAGRPSDAIWVRTVEQTCGLRAAREEKGAGWRAYPILARAPGTAWTYAFARLVAIALMSRREADPGPFARKWTAFLSSGGTMEEQPALWPFLIEPAAGAFWNDAMELAVLEAEMSAEDWNRRLSLSRPWL